MDVGTLLGPEGTFRFGVCLLAPDLDRLTHRSVCGCWCGGGRGGLGCGCVLSVA
jgi:hypothetical protein